MKQVNKIYLHNKHRSDLIWMRQIIWINCLIYSHVFNFLIKFSKLNRHNIAQNGKLLYMANWQDCT